MDQVLADSDAAPEEAGTHSQIIKVNAQNVDVFYGDKQALFGVDLEVLENRVTALIGPSGCGKSTFLRCINRMNDVIEGCTVSGEITMDGHDIYDSTLDVVQLRARVGMVFQKPNPFPKSIYDNVAFGPRLHFNIGKEELDELVEWSLKKSALWDEVKDRLKKSALGLSGGQQQRLCIARAIAVGPEVLLMDEPCSALDPASTARIEDLIYELKEQYTIVMVTHNMQQASRCSDQTAFFFEGKLVEVGDTTDVFRNPKEQRTEDYVTGKFG